MIDLPTRRRTESPPDGTTAPVGPVRRARRRTAALTVGVAAIAVLTLGCGSDEDSTAGSTTEHGTDHPAEDSGGEPTSAPLEGEAMSSDSCGHFSTLSASLASGDGTIAGPALEMFVSTLPPEMTEQGTAVVEGLGATFDGDEEALGDPAFVEAYDSVAQAMWAGCDVASRLDVTGIDYGFEGLPEQIPAGMTALRFENGSSSSEPHELIVLQRPPGDDTPIDDIAEMSVDEVMSDYPMIGVVFVDTPEKASAAFMDLPPGSYVAICTIPVGGGESGDPHAAHGMIAEFETA